MHIFLNNKNSLTSVPMALEILLSTNKTFTCHIMATHAKTASSTVILDLAFDFLSISVCRKRLVCIVKMSKLE